MIDIKPTFDKVREGFNRYMGTSGLRSFHCPIKDINNLQEKDGVSVERESTLYGIMDGLFGTKKIYVNDLTGEYHEVIRLHTDGKTVYLNDKGVTTYRCGIMTCLAISKFTWDFDSVGFIGTGRTNIQNCRAIMEIFGKKDVVIRGSARDRAKNAFCFTDICGEVVVDETDNLELINGCDVVVVCTSSYKKEDMISTAQLKDPKLIIALDSGYLLDESFRVECNNYTDYKEQINAYYDEEFPYDNIHYNMMQLSDSCKYSKGRSVVYMHGIGLADIIVANEMIKAR